MSQAIADDADSTAVVPLGRTRQAAGLLSTSSLRCLGRPMPIPVVLLTLLIVSFFESLLPAQAFPGTGSLTVEEMTSRSERIVQGRVVSARVERHPKFENLDTVVVTLSVEDTLKGTPGKTLEFRQYVWDPISTGKSAGYMKGEELLLFLRPASAYGLTSPVGMEAGRFRIRQQNQGKVAVNGVGNVGLFRAKEQSSQTGPTTKTQAATGAASVAAQGEISLDELKASIRAAVKGN